MAQAVYISTDLVNGPARATALGNLPFFNASGWAFAPPCVVLQGGIPLTVTTISDNPPTNAAAVQSVLNTLLAQEFAAAATANINAGTIQGKLNANLALIETFIAANPNGAILTAAQVNILARMLAALTRLLLSETSVTGGS